eukprot:3860562-Rhodomonas_salina.1
MCIRDSSPPRLHSTSPPRTHTCTPSTCRYVPRSEPGPGGEQSVYTANSNARNRIPVRCDGIAYGAARCAVLTDGAVRCVVLAQ